MVKYDLQTYFILDCSIMKSTESKSIFLESLVNILDNETFHNIISWSAKGDSFIIHDIKAFSDNILPSSFKHKNFASFHRQLNLYGFTRDKTNNTGKAFKNSLFVRNRPDLLSSIHKKHKESILPVMLEKGTPATKYMFISKAICELDAKSSKIGENLSGLNDKIEEPVGHNRVITEENNASAHDLERAKQILIYYANWFKANPRKFNIFKSSDSDNPIRKNSEIEEMNDSFGPDRLLCYQNDDFQF